MLQTLRQLSARQKMIRSHLDFTLEWTKRTVNKAKLINGEELFFGRRISVWARGRDAWVEMTVCILYVEISVLACREEELMDIWILPWAHSLDRSPHQPPLHPPASHKHISLQTSRAVVSNPASGEPSSWRFQLQPQSNTPGAANQGVQGYLIITDRCVGAEVCRTVSLQEQGLRYLI